MMENAPIGWLGIVASIAIGYLLGSIPSGLLITRFAGLGDVRKIGSGNIGATNVLRTGKKWAAALTLVLDAGKGAAALLIAEASFGVDGAAVAGLAAVLGHIFPVWLRFRGGKGVATFIGVMLAACWPAGLMVIATWIAVARVTRISSLSALIAVGFAPAFTIFQGNLTFALLALVLAIAVFLAHAENIQRLWRGEEPRIGESKKV